RATRPRAEPRRPAELPPHRRRPARPDGGLRVSRYERYLADLNKCPDEGRFLLTLTLALALTLTLLLSLCQGVRVRARIRARVGERTCGCPSPHPQPLSPGGEGRSSGFRRLNFDSHDYNGDRRSMSVPRSCLILGSGMGGLALGALLARAGVDVTILEAHPDYLGGWAHTFSINGYSFTAG